MTTENKPKQKPAFYIFSSDEESKLVGSAYKHDNGNGFNIIIGNTRYKAYPPRVKPETDTEA